MSQHRVGRKARVRGIRDAGGELEGSVLWKLPLLHEIESKCARCTEVGFRIGRKKSRRRKGGGRGQEAGQV